MKIPQTIYEDMINWAKQHNTRREYEIDYELDAEACFNMILQAIAYSFRPVVRGKTKDSFSKNISRCYSALAMASESRLLDIVCDCTDNFEARKLKTLIIQENLRKLLLTKSRGYEHKGKIFDKIRDRGRPIG